MFYWYTPHLSATCVRDLRIKNEMLQAYGLFRFQLKIPKSVGLCEYSDEKNSVGISKWYGLICIDTFRGQFLPISLDSFNTQQKDWWNEVWTNTTMFSPCSLLHQPTLPCTCDYYIMTWLLTITATVGKVKAQHGAISIKGIWNSITSSEAAWRPRVELRRA